MNNFNKIVSLVLCLVLSSVIMHSAGAYASDDIEQQSLKRLSPTSLMLTLDDGITQISIHEVSEVGEINASLEDFDILLINEQTASVIKDDAINLLNTGALIYYSNPELSNEDLARDLSIPKDYISHVNPYDKIGTAIYKVGNSIVFSNIYQSNSITTARVSADTIFQNGLMSAFKGAQELTVSMEKSGFQTLASYDDIIEYQVMDCYYGSKKVITIGVTHTTMRKGQFQVNGTSQWVWDAKGFTSVDPVSDYAVGGYNVRMHANITGHNLLEYSNMPNTEILTGYSVEVGYSGGPSGAVGSSWTFNPMGQTYVASMGDGTPRVRDWLVISNSSVEGMSRQSAPGIRVASGNGTGARGSFTKLTYPLYVTNWNLEAGSWF